jgi:hypothetical protein
MTWLVIRLVGMTNVTGAITYYGLTKIDGGAVVLNGTTPGAVEVNSGTTLKGIGTIGGAVTVKSAGTLAPGASPGRMTVGSLMMSSGSTLAMELGGITTGTQFDQLFSSGAMALAGTLEISLVEGFEPSLGQSFNLFDWGSVTGTFNTISLPTIAGSLIWDTTRLYTNGVISVGSAPSLRGDFNLDGAVNRSDAAIFARHFGLLTAAHPADGDLDGDGDVDLSDWGTLQTLFGTSDASLAASTAVPEPGTTMLLGIALSATVYSGCLRRRVR